MDSKATPDANTNVLLLVLDSVRAKNLSLYGYPRATTPFLERFSSESTVYTQARSAGVWSLPSHVSLLTGLHVKEHNVTTVNDKIDPEATIYNELEQMFGYSTAVFSQNRWLTDVDSGIKDSFQEVFHAEELPFSEAINPHDLEPESYTEFVRDCFTHDKPIKSALNGIYTKVWWDYPHILESVGAYHSPGQHYVDSFLQWTKKQPGPWAACVNLMDAHSPFAPLPKYDLWSSDESWATQARIEDGVYDFLCGKKSWNAREELLPLYDGAIRQLDDAIRDLVEGLRAQGLLENTLVVITADHGEAFGERSEVDPEFRVAGHELGIHESQLHVPLIVRYPSTMSVSSGNRRQGLASLVRFPDVVRRTLRGGTSTFEVENVALASSHGLNCPSRQKRVERTCQGNLDALDGERLAVYERRENRLCKHVSWKENAVTVTHLETDKPTTERGTKAYERIQEEFGQLSDSEVRMSTGGIDRMSEATRKRLQRLGYL